MSITARRELVFLLLQYLDDEEYKETVHKLERESGFFFNMKYFEECVTNGDWDEVENYLSGFSKFDENRHSMKIFFEIRKQRYLEALDRHDHAKAVEILQKYLKGFSGHNEGIFKELTMLLTLENFRENDQLSKQGDTNFARANMLHEVKQLIESNPVFCDKLQYPSFKKSRLRTLINQSLSWQHHLCQNPKQAPDMKTLFYDHSCGPPNAFDPSPVNNALMRLLPKAGGFPPIGSHGPFEPAAAQHTASLPRWMANPTSVPHQTVAAGPIGLTAPNNASSLLKRTPLIYNPAMDCQTADAEHVFKRSRPSGVSDEVNNIPVNVFPITFPGHSAHMLNSSKDLPKIVIANFSQGSAVKSMDFYPGKQSLLLVGTSIGDITVWEVGSKHRLLSRSFKIWDLAACSATLKESLVIAYTASVNRVIWSPDGSFMGVAYSKHIVHIYSYHGRDDLRNHLEIAAHVGNVTDLAFSHLNKKLCITSCGADKSIKVWDAVTGKKLYTFEGHEAPVYSVYPHSKEHISGPVVPTSGASSSSDSLIAERSEPMPVVNLSFAEGKLRKADELVKSTVGKMSENEPSPVRSLRLTGSLLPTMFVNLLVVLLLFSLPVGATEPVQSFASSCSVELEGFSPCYSYAFAAPNYHVDSPTLDCCRAYTAAVVSGDDACFCILVRNPQALGISVNKTRLLSLSSLCPTTIPSDLNSKCGDRSVKDPPAFFIPETAALEQPSMARKGSFIPAFFVLLLIGLIRIILVLI